MHRSSSRKKPTSTILGADATATPSEVSKEAALPLPPAAVNADETSSKIASKLSSESVEADGSLDNFDAIFKPASAPEGSSSALATPALDLENDR